MSTAANSRARHNLVVVPGRDLSIEFANTLAWRGSAPTESLHDIGDVLAWLVSTNAIPASAAAELRKWFEARRTHAARVFRDAIEIRELLYRLLHCVGLASGPASEDLSLLNRALSDAAPRAALERADSTLGWRIAAKPTAAGILAPVLWSAADILVGPDAARVRQCANDRCLWLFLDDSKNGTRRWCSMQSCGNRAKAHRHYLRQKGE
jgi:predicted RNA-binding Zn ribbon-like protein